MNYVITIARGFGSGGKDIGMRLSKELGIPCYDRQILTMASDQSGIDESIFVENDENRNRKQNRNDDAYVNIRAVEKFAKPEVGSAVAGLGDI